MAVEPVVVVLYFGFDRRRSFAFRLHPNPSLREDAAAMGSRSGQCGPTRIYRCATTPPKQLILIRATFFRGAEKLPPNPPATSD